MWLSSTTSRSAKKVEYGAKVHGWLTSIEKEMSEAYRFKKLQELVWRADVTEVAATKGSKTAFKKIGTMDGEAEDDDEDQGDEATDIYDNGDLFDEEDGAEDSQEDSD